MGLSTRGQRGGAPWSAMESTSTSTVVKAWSMRRRVRTSRMGPRVGRRHRRRRDDVVDQPRMRPVRDVHRDSIEPRGSPDRLHHVVRGVRVLHLGRRLPAERGRVELRRGRRRRSARLSMGRGSVQLPAPELHGRGDVHASLRRRDEQHRAGLAARRRPLVPLRHLRQRRGVDLRLVEPARRHLHELRVAHHRHRACRARRRLHARSDKRTAVASRCSRALHPTR